MLSFVRFWYMCRISCLTVFFALFSLNVMAATVCPSNASLVNNSCECNSGYTKTNHGYTFNGNTKVTNTNKNNYTMSANGYEYTVLLSGLVSGEDVPITGQVILSNLSSGLDPATPAGTNAGNKCWCRISGPFETIWKYSSSTASDFTTCATKCISKINSSSVIGFYGNVNTGVLMDGEVCETSSPTPTSYTITYDNAGGTGCPANVSYTNSQTLCTPTRDGYTFNGWKDTNTSNTYNGGASVTKLNLSLQAQWTPVQYTITYVSNGGTEYSQQTYTVVSDTVTLPTPTRDYYTFGGWYDNDQFTGNAVTTVATGSYGNKTFYAKWTPVQYTITYVSNGGTEYSQQTYTVESATVTLPTPTRDYYTFGGWYDNDQFTGDAVTTVATGSYGNKTFYAKWSQVSVTCDPGYYLPANTTECKKCSFGHYCEEVGPFNVQNFDQGISTCPQVDNIYGAYFTRNEAYDPDILLGEGVLLDSIDDCMALFWFEDSTLFPSGLPQDPEYNPDSPVNKIVRRHTSYCFYNPTTQLYDKCVNIPGLYYPTACRNGYTVNPETISGVTPLTDDTVLEIADELLKQYVSYAKEHNTPMAIPCVIGEENHYTTFYDMSNEHPESDSVKDKVGVVMVFGTPIDIYHEGPSGFGSFVDLSVLYAQCPNEYPNSAAGSWQKAHCYANVTYVFNDGSEDIVNHIHYTNATSDGYSVDLPNADRDGYIFDGWYETADFSGNAVTSATVFSGDVTLYAKHIPESCPAGKYISGTTCADCPSGYTSDENNDGDIYSCYLHDTVRCDTVNPYTTDHMSQVIYGNSNDGYASCTKYYGSNTCELDSANACAITDIQCENGYEKITDSESSLPICEIAEFECVSGVWLHIGENAKTCLSTTKVTSPAVAIEINGNKYYLELSQSNIPVNEDFTTKMRIEYHGHIYNAHDASVSVE